MVYFLGLGVLFSFGYLPMLYVASHSKRWIAILPLMGLCASFTFVMFNYGAMGKLIILTLMGPLFLSGIIISWGAFNRRPFLDTAIRAFVPVALIGLSVYLVPGLFSWTERALQQFIEFWQNSGSRTMGLIQSDNMTDISTIPTQLFGILMSDMAIRLFIMGFLLYRLQISRGIDLGIPHIKSIQFPDWPVWVVLFAISLMVGATYLKIYDTFLWAAGLSILMSIVPLYLLRGIKIFILMLGQRESERPMPNYLKFLWVLMIFYLWWILFPATCIIGLIDTWANFTDKLQKKEIKT